jgi:tetratricopeptide (TPR) repeat protein
MGKHSRNKKQETEKIGVNEGRVKSSYLPDVTGLSVQRTRTAAYAIAVLAALLTFLVYLKALNNDFLNWDDDLYIFENPHITSFDPLFIKWAFFDFYAANWHPLTWMSHALDYALWVLNPVGHHVTNNFIHAANTFLVVILTVKLLKSHQERALSEGMGTFLDDRRSLIGGGVTGLLFGLHPLHVESVAWVAERKDLLCALFFLLSIVMYTNAVMRREHGAERKSLTPGAMRYTFCFFVLSLLSKPMAVSLPAVLLIMDWFPFRRIQSMKSLRFVLVEKLPFIGLSLVSSVLTILAQKSGNAMVMMKILPLSTRLAVAAKALMTYLWNMVYPVNLIPYYPYPEDASFLSIEYLLSLLLALGISLLCVGFLRKDKLWASIWIYYIVTLIPVLGIIQVGGQAMADRYAYLPSLGPFLAMGVLAGWISRKIENIKKQTIRSFAQLAAILLLFLSLSYLTVQQISIWKNDFTLWDHVIKNQRREVPFAYYHRGLAAMAIGRIDRAMDDFNKALALDPSDYYAYVNRGMVYIETGQMDKAMEDFDKAIALNPRSFEAYTNKGMAYGRAGLLDKSIEQFNRAIEINPNVDIAYGNRGLAYALIGQPDRALEDFNKAIQLDADYEEAFFYRGNLYLKIGNRELAFADFRKACDFGEKRGCDALKAYGK